MQKALLLCLVLVAGAYTAGVAAAGLPCPEGVVGPTCATCETDEACATVFSTEDVAYTSCYTNHTFVPETVVKTYACSTEGTDLESSISNVWTHCNTELKKCDVHFAISGHPLTCSGLQCSFEENSVFCGYTKCTCDGSCPIVQGVSLGYMLDRLTGQTALDCEDGWPSALCTIDIQGLQTSEGGFQAYCQAGECRQ